jgi:hypothetical protein
MENGLFILGFHLRRYRLALADGTAANLDSQAWKRSPTTLRQHRGPLDTSADIRRLENGQFILVFITNDGLNAEVNSDTKWLIRGSPLTSSWTSAFCDLPSVVCRRIQGTGEAGDELGNAEMLTILAEEWRRNGGGMADKRHPKPCCQTLKRQPTAAVNTTELWTRLRTSDDGVL